MCYRLENPSITLDGGEYNVVPFVASRGSGEPSESKDFFMYATAWRVSVGLNISENALTALASTVDLSCAKVQTARCASRRQVRRMHGDVSKFEVGQSLQEVRRRSLLVWS